MAYLDEAYSFLLGLPGGQITLALAVFVVSAFVLYYAVMVLIALFKKLSSKTKTTLDDILADKVRRPMKIISIVVAAFLAAGAAYPDAVVWGHSTFEIFKVLLMFCAVILIDAIVDGLMMWYGKEIAPKTSSKFDDEIFPLFRKIARVLIYVLGLLIILSELGVEIAPLIAGLGIAGLAVALALQDTLGNFFAGVYMTADKPIRPNDYIKLDGTEVEGTVVEVGWRSTKILTLANNYVFVPNSKMAQTIITNFYSPETRMGYVMDFTASYDDEPEKVVEALLEAAKEVEKKTGKIRAEVGPNWARADSFGDSAVNYKVGVQVATYVDRYAVKGEMVREVYHQFKKRGISIPYPIRTVYLKGNEGEKKEIRIKKGRGA
ncbi:MAG: mechanosensitive ion channel family protein [Candidatus ainarchaeum sp.]|nr:mechanosensitive ion channel family protein [Candidatus ainarchaeum sp.]MDD5096684.1 mechanosensitive ion channel family protein [Candidatus ainarchaeum sp.]